MTICGTFSIREDFYPRSPRGERPVEVTAEDGSTKFLSTLPARGATVEDGAGPAAPHISIHAPREGSDTQVERRLADLEISIHAPREGSDESV